MTEFSICRRLSQTQPSAISPAGVDWQSDGSGLLEGVLYALSSMFSPLGCIQARLEFIEEVSRMRDWATFARDGSRGYG